MTDDSGDHDAGDGGDAGRDDADVPGDRSSRGFLEDALTEQFGVTDRPAPRSRRTHGRHAAGAGTAAGAGADTGAETGTDTGANTGTDTGTGHGTGTPPAAARPAGGAHRSIGRTVVRSVGEVLVSLGVVLLLLVVYEVWVTNLFAAQKQAEATQVLDQKWQQAHAAEVTVTAPPSRTGTLSNDPATKTVDPAERSKQYSTEMGEGFAKMYIPAFGTDFVLTVIEGTDSEDLYIGPGHYVDTQYPGEMGNFAVAGHRVSKGSPFNDLDLLRSCDAIVVETRDDWFVYRVLPMADEAATWDASTREHCQGVPRQQGPYADVVGRSIVLPEQYEVVHPVPGSPSTQVPENAERLITLTTCHPQFSAAERMIVHGILVRSYAKTPGFLPPELLEES